MINCQDCRFWVPPTVTGTSNGECHAKAPEPGKLGGTLVSWPLTGPGPGCGEGEVELKEVIEDGHQESLRSRDSWQEDLEDESEGAEDRV